MPPPITPVAPIRRGFIYIGNDALSFDYSLISRRIFIFGNKNGDSLTNTGDISYNKISFGDGNTDNVSSYSGNISNNTISFGDGGGDEVIAYGGSISNNKISFGDGGGDFVAAAGSISNSKISFGDGYNDGVQGGAAGDHNIIKMGNGDDDVVDLRFDNKDTITVGTGNLVEIHMGTDTTATVGKNGGIDTFFFEQTTQGDIGSAKIYNFDIAKDIIEISMSGSYSSVINHHNTIITINGDALDTITLVGVETTGLSFINPV
jgi:hypothetical protein